MTYDRPRCHHYTLAHYAIRMTALQYPIRFLYAMTTPASSDLLAALFDSVCAHCKDRGETPDFGPDDVKIHRMRVKGYPCAVIEMPEPAAAAEAYLTALVVPVEIGAAAPDDEDEVEGRYFTLEKGGDLEPEGATVLCGWNREGAHLNYGPGPEPDVHAFVARLAEFIR